ncbi:hypothetical protein AB1Y20_006218 [Prymnesium parvum]|uniref:Uncharacterized protein n=1 Tax=Prymnesium parvum TaxID=97485 RepID=A0AB34J419_PRYPA
MTQPDGPGIPGWAVPLLPVGTRPLIEDAFLAYLATDVVENHRGNEYYVDDGTTVMDGQSLTCDRLAAIINSDEDLRELCFDVGFCVTNEHGAHIHLQRRFHTAPPASMNSLVALEAACRTGTDEEVLAILATIGHSPLNQPLLEGCEAGYKRLPNVPSLVAPPRFEVSAATLDFVAPASVDKVAVKEPRRVPMLVVSCHAANVKVSQLLVRQFGAFTMACCEEDEEAYNPMYAAVLTSQNSAIVELLLQHGATPAVEVGIMCRDVWGWMVRHYSLLRLAIHNGVDSTIVLLLLQYGALSPLDETGRVEMLECAARAGRLDLMETLAGQYCVPIDLPQPSRAEDDEEEIRRFTPLMGAVACSQPAATEWLLCRGANPNVWYPSSHAVTEYVTPLRKAAMKGDAATIRLLRRHGADWSDRAQFSHCLYAATVGQVELEDALEGHRTTDERRVEALAALLECGAKPNEFMLGLSHSNVENAPSYWIDLSESTRKHVCDLFHRPPLPEE